MMLDQRVFRLTTSVRRQMIWTILLGLGVIAVGVGQGLLMARVLALIFQQQPLAQAWPLIGGAVILLLVAACLVWLHQRSAIATSITLKPRLRRQLYEYLLLLGPGYLARVRTGKVQSTLVDAVEGLESYIGYYIPQIFIVILAPAAILLYLVMIDWIAALIILLALLLIIFGPNFYVKALGERASRHWDDWTALNAQFLDSMQGMSTLKAFNASKRRGWELQQQAIGLYRTILAHLAISLVGSGLTGFGLAAGTALVVGISALRLSQGAITSDALFSILFLTGYCLQPLVQLNNYWHEGFYGLAGARGIFDLLDSTLIVEDKGIKTIPISERPRVTFEQVSFAYNDGERPALHSLSFEIKPGSTMALVGRSGSGKSTVVALLLRFFDPQQGRILLDGHLLSDYPLAQVRSLFAVVAQDTYLFHGSVRENLLFAKPEATQVEIEDAARAANAHDFIMALPMGYDTLVGERGSKLSGGERQRLAIARALLKNAPILILDEATSNVDAANEYEIQQALERLMANRTTLVIAHRLSTVVHADQIVVMDQGQAVESGTHETLLVRQEAYSRLIAAQQEVAR